MNDLFALDTKEEALCRSPFPAWPSLAKHGGNWVGIRNVWVFSETLPAIQVSFRSLGVEMAEKRKTCMEYTDQKETSGGLNLKRCNLHSRTPPDGTTLNRGFPKVQRGWPTSPHFCLLGRKQ